MAPILLKKREDNNSASDHSAVTTKTTASTKPSSSRPTQSREKTDNNAKVKTPEEQEKPSTKRTTSSASSTSSRSSLRSTAAKKEPQKPETPETVARKTVKTPPTAGTKSTPSAAAPALSASEKTAKPAAPLPSQTLHKHKLAAVWTSGKKKHKTNFGSAYDSGSIPCRINHGSIRNALHWTKEPSTLDFNPLLITCVEGFLETEHPFVFLARTMFRELMQLEDAREKTLSVLPQVIPPLRVALMASDEDVFLMALEATRILSDSVEDEMNTYLPKLTQQIHRKLLTKQLRAPVEDTLATLERNGGKEALTIIRSKIPTYVSVH